MFACLRSLLLAGETWPQGPAKVGSGRAPQMAPRFMGSQTSQSTKFAASRRREWAAGSERRSEIYHSAEEHPACTHLHPPALARQIMVCWCADVPTTQHHHSWLHTCLTYVVGSTYEFVHREPVRLSECMQTCPQAKHSRTIDASLNERIDRLVESDSAFRQLRLWKCHDDVRPCHSRSILTWMVRAQPQPQQRPHPFQFNSSSCPATTLHLALHF